MIAVLFELTPRPGARAEYLAAAAALRDELERQDGFLSVERFESLTTPGNLLSISFWRDEEAVRRWRGHPAHRAAQAAGRERLFERYRLRVATVMRDYGDRDRAEAPPDLAGAPAADALMKSTKARSGAGTRRRPG